tara:strand:+ start:118069 stop:118227 length:159 start_codon:yes stop_codon:yes gene_type:complete
MQSGTFGLYRGMPDFKYPCHLAGVFAFGTGIFVVAKAAGRIAVDAAARRRPA